MRVLIADDTILMRAMLSEMVREFGHSVVLARDGQEALDKAWEEGFDVAIVDWEMPKLDGIEVCWHLRSDPRSAYAYLILMTANEEPWRQFKALDAGADDFIPKPVNAALLKARLRAAGRLLAMHEQLLELALTDPLTGVFNRRAFLERAEGELARTRRTGRPLSALMCDIDHFKRINDTHGHAAGDEALKRFAACCRAHLRVSDVLGRLGGEEFAILLPETGAGEAVLVAERLREAVAGLEVESEEARFGLTVSIGATAFLCGADTVDRALARADEALYRAKTGGRNRVELAV